MKTPRKVLTGEVVGYALCVIAFVWLALENLYLRQSLRTSLSQAYSLMSASEANDRAGKVLNWYFESIYVQLPDPIAPGLLLIAGSVLFFVSGRRNRSDERKRGQNLQ